MKIKAYGKLNLTLEITGEENEFHTIESIAQKISLYDEIEIKLTKGNVDVVFFSKSIRNRVSTIDKAIELFRDKTGIKDHFIVNVHKNIPMGSGLGGGSADAAYTLIALNQMFNNPLTFDELLGIAKDVGKDVPLFLYGSTVRMSHYGEVVEEITSLNEMYFILVHPLFHHKTKVMYDMFRKFGKFSDGNKTKALKEVIEKKSYTALEIQNYFYNDFEIMLMEASPKFANYKKTLSSLSDLKFYLTGSGSTLFTPFDSEKDILKTKTLLEKLKINFSIVKTV